MSSQVAIDKSLFKPFDYLDDLVVIVDQDNRMLYCNHKEHSLVHSSCDIDNTVKDMLPKELSDKVAEAIGKLSSGDSSKQTLHYSLPINEETRSYKVMVKPFEETLFLILLEEVDQKIVRGLNSIDNLSNHTSDISMTLSLDGELTAVSENLYPILGYKPEQLLNQKKINAIHTDDRPKVRSFKQKVIDANGTLHTHIVRFVHQKGNIVYLEVVLKGVLDMEGNIIALQGLCRQQTKSVLTDRLSECLKGYLDHSSLELSLNELGTILEEQFPYGIPYILKRHSETDTLCHVYSSQRMAPDYRALLNEFPVGPNSACGNAAFTKKPIFISQVSTHPFYEPIRDLIEGHQIQACWAFPLLSKENEVLGTCSFYFIEAQLPTSKDKEYIHLILPYIATLLEQDLYRQVQREKELLATQLKSIALNVPGMVYQYILYPDGAMKISYVSDAVEQIYGVTKEEAVRDASSLFNAHHPDDKDRLYKSISDSATALTQWNYVGRIIVKGKIKWVHGLSNPIKHNDGKIVWDGVVTDITDKKTLEKELVESDLKWKSILKQKDISVNEIDRNYNVLKCSNIIESFKGILTKEKVEKMNVKDFFSKEEWEGQKSFYERCFNGEYISYTFELDLSGSKRILESQLVPIHSVDESIQTIMSITTDVTEVKESAHAQVQISKELTQLIDTANAPIFGVDKEGKVNEWNKKVAEITGYSKEDVTGRDLVRTYISEDYKSSVSSVLKNALEGKETANYEVPIFTKEGSRVELLLNATTRRDIHGDIVGVVGVGQDITELDSVRKDLSISNIRWKSMIQNQQLAITETNLNLEFTFCSNVLSVLSSVFSKEMIVGKSAEMFYASETWLKMKTKFKELVEKGKYFTDEMSFQVKGFEIITQNQWFPIYKEDKVDGIICITTDITEQKIAEKRKEEAEVKQARAEQQKEEAEQQKEAAEFTKMQVELESQIKSEFIGNMSHELRTPLNTIMGFGQVLDEKLIGPLTEKQGEYIKEILLSSRHLLGVINDVLDISKVESNAHSLEKEAVHLYQWIKGLKSNTEYLFTEKDILFNIDYTDETLAISADKIKLKQILFNLISNAIKFSPVSSEITLLITEKENTICIAVQDQGPGIPSDDHDIVFKAFSQASQGKEKLSQGAGLGLYLARKFAELHDGSLSINPEYKAGCEMVLELPYTR